MAELEIKPTPAARLRVIGTLSAGAGIVGVLVFLLTGGGRNFFEEKATIFTYMPDVTGLAVKSEVRQNGIAIGSVRSIRISGMLDRQRAVRVEMRLGTRYLPQIPQDALTSIGADTLIGYKFVDIGAGKSQTPLAADGSLHSEPLKQADDRADLVRFAQSELHQIDDLLIQMSSPNTPLGKFVFGEAEYDDVLAKISDFDKGVRSMVGPDSPTGQALFSDALYNQIRGPLLRTDNMLAAIQRGEGAAGKLFVSDEQYNNLVRSLRGIRAMLADANAGKGQFGAMLKDDAAYAQIRKMLAETDALLGSLNAGEGAAGRMLSNAQLYESLNGSLSNLQAFLKDLRENPKKYLRYKVF
jgi:phospholipid/cholesterol/gamma-HCH transport system substrate-binding protein